VPFFLFFVLRRFDIRSSKHVSGTSVLFSSEAPLPDEAAIN
jgi:hypothetical protein